MFKIEFFIGTGFDAQNVAISKKECAACLQATKAILAKKFGGYSCTNVQGGYMNSSGELVEEQSVCFTIFTSTNVEQTAETYGKVFAQIFNQESVLTVVHPCTIQFENQ